MPLGGAAVMERVVKLDADFRADRVFVRTKSADGTPLTF